MDSMGNGDHLPATRADIENLLVVVKTDFEGLRTGFEGLRTDFEGLRTDFGGLRTDFEGLRTDFGELRTEFGVLRTDVKNEIETQVGGLRDEFKTEAGRLDAKIVSSVRRLAMEIVDVKTEVRELREVVANDVAMKADIKHLVDAVDRFAGKSQSYDAAKILHGQALTDVQVQMNDHERRIKGLEDRPH